MDRAARAPDPRAAFRQQYHCPVCPAVWSNPTHASLHLISVHGWRTMAVIQWLRRVEEAQS